MRSSRKKRNPDAALEAFRDPVKFTEFMLGRHVWAKQKEIMESVRRHRRTAVKACHASSKTFTAAALVLWWITTYPEAIAITTAPTWAQVERVLWGEIRAMAQYAKIAYPKPGLTSLHLGNGRYAIGLSTNEGVRFQGFHGKILIVLDEAPGVLPEIYEAIEGIQAGGDVRVLALGNPVIASGPFYDAFTENRDSWNLITISAFDTPNFEGVSLERLLAMPDEEIGQDPWPCLINRRWVREKYYEWGPGHPLWDARVLGLFPQQAEDALLSLSWLEQAKLRTEGDGEMFAGIDVAGPGEDETVVFVRQGQKITHLRSWSGRDARGDVLALLLPLKSQLKGVNVDRVGIGYYMARHLEDHGLPVNDVNVGKAARDSDKYANWKAQLFWQFRELAAAGQLAGLTDDKTIAQLAGIRYRHNSRGQIVIESKEEARKRGVKSPDRAEALILAFAEVAPPFGLIEYYLQETARLRGENRREPAPAACPQCGNPNLAMYGDRWQCSPCGATGDVGKKPTPPCPDCQSTAVAPIPGEFRCNMCGKQFGRKIEPPHWPNRWDALGLMAEGRLRNLSVRDWKL